MSRIRVDRGRVIELFRSVQQSFPNLTMTLHTNPDKFDAALEIPRQPGLAFNIFLNLQDDELHLEAGESFLLEWFPCTDAGVEADYFATVRGLITGEFRIVEYHGGGEAYRAVLQRPKMGGGWQGHGTWSRVHGPVWRRRQVVLHNRQGGEAPNS